MKKRIYLETTVVSYLTARPSRDIMIAGHQDATREVWPQLSAKYETYISALVFQEAGKGDPDQARQRLAAIESFPILDIDDEARSLAEEIFFAAPCPGNILKMAFISLWRLSTGWKLSLPGILLT